MFFWKIFSSLSFSGFEQKIFGHLLGKFWRSSQDCLLSVGTNNWTKNSLFVKVYTWYSFLRYWANNVFPFCLKIFRGILKTPYYVSKRTFLRIETFFLEKKSFVIIFGHWTNVLAVCRKLIREVVKTACFVSKRLCLWIIFFWRKNILLYQ